MEQASLLGESGHTYARNQPVSLWVLSLIAALTTWGFANLMSCLTLYLAQSGYSLKNSYDVYTAFVALFWVIPLLGGWVAQYVGYAMCSYVGLIGCIVAMLSLWLGMPHNTSYALSLFVVGNGFFVPSLWCLVDHLYPKKGSARRIGFTFFYIIFNVGGVLGIFIGGFLATMGAHHYNFLLNGILNIVALLILSYFYNYLMDNMNRPVLSGLRYTSLMRLLTLLAVIAAMLTVVWFLFKYHRLNQVFLMLCIFLGLGILLHMANKQSMKSAKQKIYVFLSLSAASFLFWSLYNLEPSVLSVFADHYVNRHVGGIVVPATVFFGFACVAAIIVGLILNKFWQYCAAKKKDIGLFFRVSMSLLLMGLGYLYLMGLIVVGDFHPLSTFLFALCYLLFTCGELFVGPLGMSMAGELSPQGKEGVFMGLWQLTIGVSAILSDHLAKMTVPDNMMSWYQGLQGYEYFFMFVGILSVLFALMLFLVARRFDGWLKKLD